MGLGGGMGQGAMGMGPMNGAGVSAGGGGGPKKAVHVKVCCFVNECDDGNGRWRRGLFLFVACDRRTGIVIVNERRWWVADIVPVFSVFRQFFSRRGRSSCIHAQLFRSIRGSLTCPKSFAVSLFHSMLALAASICRGGLSFAIEYACMYVYCTYLVFSPCLREIMGSVQQCTYQFLTTRKECR
jgi:hypothetical protein